MGRFLRIYLLSRDKKFLLTGTHAWWFNAEKHTHFSKSDQGWEFVTWDQMIDEHELASRLGSVSYQGWFHASVLSSLFA